MSVVDHPDDYIVWVLAPYIETQDPNLRYYYDYTQSIAEYQTVFSEIGCEWKWVNVTYDTIASSIRAIRDYPTRKTAIVINLCDGDELNGIPGISVIHTLERFGLVFTGANQHFFEITTSKIPMKEAFMHDRVPTPSWKVIETTGPGASLFEEVGDVLIVKPAVSAGSLGISIKSVVSNEVEYSAVMNDIQCGYHGWKLDAGGIFVEEFIRGREFTTLVVGSSEFPESIKVYTAVERVFHSSLPEKEQFLSFDRLWEMYDEEAPLPDKGTLYTYYQPENELIKQLETLTIAAYRAVGGTGYGRLDFRMDRESGALYVLEVNAQCGLSEDENYTSIGAILRFAKKSFTSLVIEIMDDAMVRYGAKHKARQ